MVVLRLPPVRLVSTSAGDVGALGRVDYPGAIELIVVVDGSNDGTGDALTPIDCPFPMTIIVQQNAGASAARNRGAAIAANDVIWTNVRASRHFLLGRATFSV